MCFLMLKINKMGFQEALRKKYDLGAIFWRKKSSFWRCERCKNEVFAWEGCNFWQNSSVDVGASKTELRRVVLGGFLGSKMGSKPEKWGPKGRWKVSYFQDRQRALRVILGNPGVRPQNPTSNEQFSVQKTVKSSVLSTVSWEQSYKNRITPLRRARWRIYSYLHLFLWLYNKFLNIFINIYLPA